VQRKRTTSRSLKKVYSAIDSRFPEHLEQYRAFLRQKSISATGEGIRETAEWVKCFIDGREVAKAVLFALKFDVTKKKIYYISDGNI
jgi:hypothetical protein